jgi:uncharacterized cupin superfamily protein
MTPEVLFTSQFLADASALVVPLEDVPASQLVSGAPQTGLVELGAWNGFDTGVWEMTPGVMTDVEVDELCVILSGAGTVERVIDGHTVNQKLAPGAVLALRGGEATVWNVSTTVRKVYLVPTNAEAREDL